MATRRFALDVVARRDGELPAAFDEARAAVDRVELEPLLFDEADVPGFEAVREPEAPREEVEPRDAPDVRDAAPERCAPALPAEAVLRVLPPDLDVLALRALDLLAVFASLRPAVLCFDPAVLRPPADVPDRVAAVVELPFEPALAGDAPRPTAPVPFFVPVPRVLVVELVRDAPLRCLFPVLRAVPAERDEAVPRLPAAFAPAFCPVVELLRAPVFGAVEPVEALLRLPPVPLLPVAVLLRPVAIPFPPVHAL